jgi:hypothetical protein
MQFLKGLKAERYNTASRIRNHCAAILGVHEVDLMNAEVRKTKFRERIGWIQNDNGAGSYSAVDVEILHKNYSGEYSLSSVFLNPILMGVSLNVLSITQILIIYLNSSTLHLSVARRQERVLWLVRHINLITRLWLKFTGFETSP